MKQNKEDKKRTREKKQTNKKDGKKQNRSKQIQEIKIWKFKQRNRQNGNKYRNYEIKKRRKKIEIGKAKRRKHRQTLHGLLDKAYIYFRCWLHKNVLVLLIMELHRISEGEYTDWHRLGIKIFSNNTVTAIAI
jgi:hypothetical protein